MVRAAEFVYRVHQHRYLVRIDIGMNAVPQVEYMAVGFTESCQHLGHMPADRRGGGIQYRGIQVPLQRNPVPRNAARGFDVHGPVQPDGVTTGPCEILDPEPSSLGK